MSHIVSQAPGFRQGWAGAMRHAGTMKAVRAGTAMPERESCDRRAELPSWCTSRREGVGPDDLTGGEES